MGFDAVGEGAEEVFSGILSNLGSALYKEESIEELLTSEEAIDEYIESFIGGAFLGGFSSSIREIRSKNPLTDNEKKVVDKEVENRVAERESDGKELTKSEKNKIRKDVITALEKGDISTDVIESALGGETYEKYKSVTEQEEALQNEFDTLNKMKQGDMTGEQIDRRAELKQQLEELKNNSQKTELKDKLSNEVFTLAENSRLAESYNEKTRRGQSFEADLSKYDAKQQEVVKKAVESGILNNTNRTHDFVDMVAKLSAEKGVLFDFVNNEKLKNSGFAIQNKTVNGYVTDEGNIAINMQSQKALESVVGHEITHILEGTELYTALQNAVKQYATTKGEYAERMQSLRELYTGVYKGTDFDTKLQAELTADIVGDYLFTDSDFINSLSTEQPNLFKKIYNEIKYLCKIATAGSKEARELEKVKRAFDKVWKESGTAQKNTTNNGGAKYDINLSFDKNTDITYDSLISKPDMVISEVTTSFEDVGELSRSEIVEKAIEKLSTKKDSRGVITIHNTDIGEDIVIGKRGLEHGLDRDFEYTAMVTLDLEGYLENAIKINEAIADKNRDHDSDILLGYGETATGERIPAYFVVSKLTTGKKELIEFGSLYSINAKKIAEDSTQGSPGFQSRTSATISIAKLLDIVNNSYSDILPQSVADHYGIQRRNTKLGRSVKYSLSDSKGRELSLAVQKRFGNSKAVDDNGNLKVLYHGTPSGEFTIFDKSKGSVEGDFGSGFYFTDNNADVTNNYEGGGPDFENKVARRAEQIEQEEDIDYDEAEKRAREELFKGSHKFEVYLNIEKPAIVGETTLFDNESYLEEYDEGDFEDYDEYIAEVEQLVSDDIEKIIWDVERSIDIFSTDGLSDILVEAYYEGGIGIEELKSKINELYLEDNEGNLVGNEVTRQIIESLGYDGIIDPTVSHKWNMEMEEGTTHYIVFKPNQIKSVTNENPTDNPDIYLSLSKEGEQPTQNGRFYGKDMLLDAPIRDDIAEKPTSDLPDDTPIREDIAKPISEDEANAMLQEQNENNPLTDEDVPPEAEPPIRTTKQKISAKLNQSQTELDKNIELRDKSNSYYDEKIAKLQAEYDTKTNKDTKSANSILRSIERYKRIKANTDADYEKRINDIESRMTKLNEQLLSNHDRADRLEQYKKRADARLEAEKKVLSEDFAQRKAELQEELKDKNTYISNKAMELYKEFNGLRKGVRASEELAYFLDYGFNWAELKSTLLKVNKWSDTVINPDSEIESIVREAIGRDYEEKLHELDDIDNEYNRQVEQMEADAKKKLDDFKVANQRMTKQQELRTQMEELVGDTSTWVDKKMGISYKVNTLRRNLRDIVRDESGKRNIAKADAIYDELQGKYNHNEAELNRESNRIKQQFAEMKITSAEDTYIQMLGELRYNPETTLTKEVVKEFYEKHKSHIDEAKVDKAIEMARPLYDDLLSRVNQVLSEQGMKEIPYRKGYFPHFTEDKQGFLAKLFNWKTKNNDIPTDIAGLTENFNPDRSWQSFNKQRKSDTTDYSFLKGLDTYVQGSLDWIYHIEDIQKRRAFENHIRYVHSEQGIKDRIDAIRNNEEYDANEMQDQIDIVYKEARNPLNNFITDFRTATNTLAGKKSSLDRGTEELTNRKFYSTMTNLSNRVSANMVGGSISSALTNFIPITQSWGQVSPVSSLRAMGGTIVSTFRDDGTIDKSDFLTNRLRQSENLYKTFWDKAGKGVGILMEGIDNFTSQTVWRSKYLENISDGMSENEAVKNADQFAENVLAGRSRGNNPTIFDSKNPFAKILTVFQLEVNNQYGYMFKDMPQDVANESKVKLIKGYATMFLGAYAYNALYSSLVGRNAAFDPIRIFEELFRDLGFGGDDEEEEEIAPTDAVLNLTNNVLEELPFVGGLLGGGRIPLSSALPYGGITEAYEGTLQDVEDKDWSNLTKEWLNPVYYLAMPMGGGQIKKTAQGLKMFDDDLPIAGSYTDSGNLRFPVEDTPLKKVQAALFGQYANKNAKAYFDNDIAPLKENQIQEFIDVDIPIADYWKYREGLSGLETLNEKGDYIGDLDLPISKKNILINNIADRDEPIDYTDFDLYSDFEEFDFATRYPEKYKVLQEQGISVKDYKENYEETAFMYTDDFSWASNNPEKYTLSKAVTDDVMEYKQYTTDLSNIKADKDSNGKSISGSRKEKVLEYINNLDIEYGAKCILLKSQYPSDDTYNNDIVDYLNGRDDISFDEMRTILEELGATVDDEGYINW